jgi:uncharacterized beta barrel domain-containing protein DUF5777
MSPRRRVPSRLLVFQCLFVALLTGSAAAQTPPAPVPEPQDDAKVRPMEPDYKLINLPTSLPLPVRGMNFGLTHRFGGNLREGSFTDQLSSLFGLDEGAIIGLEFRYGVARGLQATVFRTNFDRTIQFSGKWEALRQDASHLISVSAIASVEGGDNFQERYSPSLGVAVSHHLRNRVIVYATPVWVHNSGLDAVPDRNTGYIGLGGRVRFGESVYLVAEVSPRVAGYAPGDPEYGFGIEKRVGGHTFQLNFTNTFGTTPGQLARGGSPDTLYLGFNLARRFF